jgi:hypothetical protein
VSYFKTVKIDSDNPVGDAFGRLRTSSPTSIFDAQLTYDLQPLLFEALTTGTGATVAHDATNRCALMTFASTPTGGRAAMQSYEHFRYRAGHSQLIYVTFNMGGGVANVMKFAGYSDGTNGIEFQMNGTTPQVTIYSSTGRATETVAQTSWNLDKLNGSGASAITIDLSKVQILVIDLQALYVGRVRVGFDINGVVTWAHEFRHANVDTLPYFATANLPIRCGMTCTGTVSTTMRFICSTVQSENGESAREGFHFSQDATATAGASGALTHLVSLQPKTTFNGIANRTKIIIDSVDIIVTGNQPVHYAIVLGDVLTGTTTFLDVNATYSATQYNLLGTTSGAPAITMYTGHIPASATSKGSVSQNVIMKYPITLDAAGAARALGRVTVLVASLGGTSSTVEGAINFTEIR